jgi:SAM-dependent methyltransferase
MLQEKDVIGYWKNRSLSQKERTVGFANGSIDDQNKEYQVRFDFIIPKIPQNKFTLDYGCGIGRYSSFFDPVKYLGVDIMENLLDMAKARNPGYKYNQLTTPYLDNIDFKPEVIMTTTVLQHNNADLVDKIIGGWIKLADKPIQLVLYENSHAKPDLAHISFRQVADYRCFVCKHFTILEENSWSHVIHGEQHSLMIFSVLKKPAC